jgi:hypothetical protein
MWTLAFPSSLLASEVFALAAANHSALQPSASALHQQGRWRRAELVRQTMRESAPQKHQPNIQDRLKGEAPRCISLWVCASPQQTCRELAAAGSSHVQGSEPVGIARINAHSCCRG